MDVHAPAKALGPKLGCPLGEDSLWWNCVEDEVSVFGDKHVTDKVVDVANVLLEAKGGL